MFIFDLKRVISNIFGDRYFFNFIKYIYFNFKFSILFNAEVLEVFLLILEIMMFIIIIIMY